MGPYILKLDEVSSLKVDVAADGTVTIPLVSDPEMEPIPDGTYSLFNSDNNQVGSVTITGGIIGKFERLLLAPVIHIEDDGAIIFPEGTVFADGRYIIIDESIPDTVGEFAVKGGVVGKLELYPRHTDIVFITLGFGHLFDNEDDDGGDGEKEYGWPGLFRAASIRDSEVSIFHPYPFTDEEDGFGPEFDGDLIDAEEPYTWGNYDDDLADIERFIAMIEERGVSCHPTGCDKLHAAEDLGYSIPDLRKKVRRFVREERAAGAEQRLKSLIDGPEEDRTRIGYSSKISVGSHLARLCAILAWVPPAQELFTEATLADFDGNGVEEAATP